MTQRQNPSFDWQHYAPIVRQAIFLAGKRARALRVCSICKKRRVRDGVLVPPALKLLQLPAGVVPLPYAVCREHERWTSDQVGDVLCPGWRQYDTP